jgi:hypothetical protein
MFFFIHILLLQGAKKRLYLILLQLNLTFCCIIQRSNIFGTMYLLKYAAVSFLLAALLRSGKFFVLNVQDFFKYEDFSNFTIINLG